MDAQYNSGPNLTQKQTIVIKNIMNVVVKIMQKIKEPIDPKVLNLLGVCYSMLDEQIVGDKIYKWENQESPPSVDELNRWLEE